MALKPFYNKKYHLGYTPEEVKNAIAGGITAPILLTIENGAPFGSFTYEEIVANLKKGKTYIYYTTYTSGNTTLHYIYTCKGIGKSTSNQLMWYFDSYNNATMFFESSNNGQTWQMGH